LKTNKELLEKGDGDSSSGSDSAPSDDNLDVEEIARIMPVIDKQTKLKLNKKQKNKEKELKESKQGSRRQLNKQSSKQQISENEKNKKKEELNKLQI
jgi:hypothetical protein